MPLCHDKFLLLFWYDRSMSCSGVEDLEFQIFLNYSMCGYIYFEQLLCSVKTIVHRNILANTAVPRLIPCYLSLENTESLFI